MNADERVPAAADPGGHRLPDLARPVRVMQLGHPGVGVDFPALRSLDAFAHNLPVQLTSFIGRDAEMTQVRALMRDSRLVTLTGAGGVGKTRLALQVAAGVLTWYPAGVWHVDLAPLTDAAMVAVTVARALGLSDEVGRSPLAMAAGFIGARRALVVLDNCEHLLEPCAVLAIRQYAAEKLGDSGEADQVRTRHRDHYAALAARLGPPADGDPRRLIRRLEADIDNLRAAFGWSLELSDAESALQLTSSLQPLWLGRCRMLEGLAWFDAVPAAQPATAEPIAAEVQARALADAAVLADWTGAAPRLTRAEEAVALARELGDPALLARALLGAAYAAGLLAEAGRPYFAEAIAVARQAGDEWTLAQILGRQGFAALVSGDLVAGRAACEEGLACAERTGNDHAARNCKTWLGAALLLQSHLRQAKSLLSALIAEAEAERVPLGRIYGLAFLGQALALMGQPGEARTTGEPSIAIADTLGLTIHKFFGYDCLCTAAMACGDGDALREASQAAWQHAGFRPEPGVPHHTVLAYADLAANDLGAARQHAEQAVTAATTLGMRHQLMQALLASARVAAATGDTGPGHDDAHQALTVARGIESRTGVIDALECLGGLSAGTDDRDKAARLFGAGLPTRRSPPGSSCRRAPCKRTSPTCTASSASPPECNSPSKPRATPSIRQCPRRLR